MKKFFAIFIVLISLIQSTCNAKIEYSPEIDHEISEQLKINDVKLIENNLPQYSIDLLKKTNIDSIFAIKNLDIQKLLIIIISSLKDKLSVPIKILIPIIFILIFFSVFSSFCESNQEILKFIIVCLVFTSVSYSLIFSIKNLNFSLNLASKFILCFIPVFMSFAIASGSPLAAVSFNSTVLYFNQIIIDFVQNLLMPITNVMISLCLISSLSKKIKFEKLFKAFDSLIKWMLISLAMVVSFVFSIQKIVGNSVDNILTKKVRFFAGLVPIVGTSLCEATSIVRSSAKIIESNLGAFGIISVLFIFLPPLLECYAWNLSLQICEFLGQMFGFDQIGVLFSSLRKIINISLAISIIFIFVFMFATSAIMKIQI